MASWLDVWAWAPGVSKEHPGCVGSITMAESPFSLGNRVVSLLLWPVLNPALP